MDLETWKGLFFHRYPLPTRLTTPQNEVRSADFVSVIDRSLILSVYLGLPKYHNGGLSLTLSAAHASETTYKFSRIYIDYLFLLRVSVILSFEANHLVCDRKNPVIRKGNSVCVTSQIFHHSERSLKTPWHNVQCRLRQEL